MIAAPAPFDGSGGHRGGPAGCRDGPRLLSPDIDIAGQETTRYLSDPDLISYARARTDLFGHSNLITNPRVSTDLIELIRYGKQLGEPGGS